MKKKIIIVLFVIIFLFLGFNKVSANVIINEIQISGVNADDEFIELYNSGDIDVDLTNWYINKKSSTGNETTIVSESRFKDKVISRNSYLLLARENGYVGSHLPDILWPNSYSLSSNNSIILYKGNEIDKIEKSWETIDTGNSLQLLSGVWKMATPTPGIQNEEVPVLQESGGNSTGGSSSSSSVSSQTETKTKTIETQKIKTKIIAKNLAFVNVPVVFDAVTTGYQNEQLSYGKYFWNFGDGDSKEMKVNNREEFTHTFFYKGEYSVSLEYYQNYYSEIPDATAKILIKIIPADVSISNIGDEKDFFIEISNNTEYDADISKWILSGKNKIFTFPKNMILESEKKIVLSPKITGFSIEDKDDLKLMNSQWDVVYNYKVIPENNFISYKKNIPAINDIEKNTKEVSFLENKENLNFFENNNSNINISENNLEMKKENNYIYWYIFIIFLFACSFLVYFIRIHNRGMTNDMAGSDFEILDE